MEFKEKVGEEGGHGAFGAADYFVLESVEEFGGYMSLSHRLLDEGDVVEGSGYAGG